MVADPYYPTPAELAALNKAITDRISCTVTALPSGKGLIAGGNPAEVQGGFVYPSGNGASNGHTAALATTEIYDPIDGSSMPTGRMSTPRVGAESVLLRNGEVLIVGGENWTDVRKNLAYR